MEPIVSHPWNLTKDKAQNLQRKLSNRVIAYDQLDELRLVAGVDVSYQKDGNKVAAAIVIVDAETLELVEEQAVIDMVNFPYVSGLFSFRELPPLIKAFAKVRNRPNLIVCDGHGIAHPFRFGFACHLGVIFDVPTIGCAKSPLIGDYEEPDPRRGGFSPLYYKKDVIGGVLRTQSNVNPLYISIGHRVSLATACSWILRLSPKYRLPETIRKADQLVKKMLNESLG